MAPLDFGTMRDLIESTLGHYRIVERIGAGGMGEVYRAHDERLDRDVAIKVLPEAVANDPERMRRFEREAKALAALNHPNIATVHGLESAASGTGTGSSLNSQFLFFRVWRPAPETKKPGRETRREQGKKMWSVEAGAPSDSR